MGLTAASRLIAQHCTGGMCKSMPLVGNAFRQVHTPAVKEVSIPTVCGHVAGKWWGREDRQPILALHGWQDNAGTWDTLLPLLPADYSVLAIDFPGHGKSSWIPKGLHYTHPLYLQTIRDVMEHYKWEKVGFLGHSMGSIIAFTYTSLFPENVNFHIAVENIVPDIPNNVEHLYKRMANSLINLSIEQKRLGSEPPAYSYEEAIMRWHMGTKKSVSLESAHFLVDRGTKKSLIDPTKYFFCRDARLKYSTQALLKPEYIEYGIKRLKLPVLYIKGIDSKYATDELAISCRDLLAQSNDKYEYHLIPGTHHLHLNNPQNVAPIVTRFLQKYAPVDRYCCRAKL